MSGPLGTKKGALPDWARIIAQGPWLMHRSLVDWKHMPVKPEAFSRYALKASIRLVCSPNIKVNRV